jgi:2,4-dienoyl-CoA reductase-like NADH-dependent reductase (Old Yellow Enzyme family)
MCCSSFDAMQSFPHLLSPLTIGNMTVRNRILVSAHVPGFAEQNKPGEKYLAYQRIYAKNGVGLQITGGTPVHHSGLLGTSSDALRNLDDGIIPGYRALGEAVHEQGGRILAQLAHSAGTVLINQPGRASWAASAIRSETSGNISHAMTQSEINEVIAAFAAAADRVRQGNLDGVEILGAFGFLPQAFLSPLSNHRQDEYGGSLENRLRFTLELLAAVRQSLGPGPVLGMRIPGDEFEAGGLGLEEMKIVAQKLAASGLIDFLNVIAHTNLSHTGRSLHWAPTPSKHGIFIPLAAAIRTVVDIPVFGVGRVTSPHLAESIIADGQADMVGMTRANICDPELVSKIQRGDIEQIRPCVGANTCIANRYAGKPINCLHNAQISTPGSSLQVTARPRKIAVIGAGPAGLEASRVAAECGHEVQLFEAGPAAGGQLLLWAATESMTELGNIIHWRLRELERLGVEIECNRHLHKEAIARLGADLLIVATGAVDYTRLLDGNHNIDIVSPHQVLRGRKLQRGKAIVVNEGRGQAGLAAAEVLLNGGMAVEIITTDIAVANDLDPSNRDAWYTRLGQKSCDFSAALSLVGADAKSLRLRNVYDDRSYTRDDIDLIVDWPGCRANNELTGLRLDHEVHFIGDCVAPRTLEIAISEALGLSSKVFN